MNLRLDLSSWRLVELRMMPYLQSDFNRYGIGMQFYNYSAYVVLL